MARAAIVAGLVLVLWVGGVRTAGAVLDQQSASRLPREAAPGAVAPGDQGRAIILFVGDGMGDGQRLAARWSAVGQDGLLAMETMPIAGLSRTASADHPVTDSAAAATALATGVKTDNGVIAQNPAGHDLTTILERAQARGMAVGLVTTTQMAHATPAAFASHVPSRSMMTEIASQMLAHEVDVMLGGGEDEFLPAGAVGRYPEPGEREDGRNLVAEATVAGYTYVYDATAFAALVPTSTVRLLGLFADEGMTRPFSPSLAEMTQTAIAILSQDPEGFFLMVEGGQIDWACHLNDAATAISDTVGLDEAVVVAQSYASTRDGVLVIVTGDHETGGMTVSLSPTGSLGEDGSFHMPEGTPFYVNWTTGGHTGEDVPTTAQGFRSHLLAGTDENTHIYDVMYEALDWWTTWLPTVLR
jgi:alkaline phosphatase